MLGVTALALTAILVGLGTVADEQAARADARRVADGLDRALRPVSATGPHTGTVAFADGRLRSDSRALRVYRNGSHVSTVAIDVLVFDAGDHRVAASGGAIVRGRPGNAWFVREPSIQAGDGVLVVGTPRLNDSGTAVSGAGRTRIQTNVTHNRTALGTGTYRLEVETATPGPWSEYFTSQGATVSRTDRDGDAIEGVEATYPDSRRAYLVVHDMRLEVGDG
jgi:hypothetical protein